MVAKYTRPDLSLQSLTLQALFLEYEAVYRLAEFRLGALDRRIPLIGGILTGFLSMVPILPDQSQILGLIAIPISLVWLVRTSINHARSFEDAIRAIEDLEGKINRELGQDVVGFQSTHPSKGKFVGGRTGSETVMAVILVSCLLLCVSLWIGFSIKEQFGGFAMIYFIGIGAIATIMFSSVRTWRRYKYRVSKQ